MAVSVMSQGASLLYRPPPILVRPTTPLFLPLIPFPSHALRPRLSISPRAVLPDACALALVGAGGYSLVRCFDILTEKKLIGQKLSRKLVHVFSGLLFMASWSIFSDSFEARFFAAFVPFLNSGRLLIHGLSIAVNEDLVRSLSREGKPEELLRGPLYYVLVLMLCALFFWRNSPVGVVSLSMMCGGDGFADIMGRNFGSVKLPYNKEKSWVGSVFMFISGFSVSMLMLYYFSMLGYMQLEWATAAKKVAFIALAATVVESLPFSEVVDDNVSVPVTSMLMTFLFFY
ncbi:probable phytol kinase, chloroplastic [Aristolochia californica]|uniref:probable phytol kinase, chloroplastic n=1 Tax=Aristolochia californica TaxID=171875 RepID=UPI0035E17390